MPGGRGSRQDRLATPRTAALRAQFAWRCACLRSASCLAAPPPCPLPLSPRRSDLYFVDPDEMRAALPGLSATQYNKFWGYYDAWARLHGYEADVHDDGTPEQPHDGEAAN